jgi:hypothetical protein
MKALMNWIQRSHWSLYFVVWVAGLVLLGSVLGAILFPLGGLLLNAERSSAALMARGAHFGSFYFLIWAPGVALCAAVMRAYRRRHPDAEKY